MALPLLFLIADTGGGHRAGATAVARRLEIDRPGEFDVHIVDPIERRRRHSLLGRTADLYGPLIHRARWVWAAMYHATNSATAVGLMQRSALRPLRADAAGPARPRCGPPRWCPSIRCSTTSPPRPCTPGRAPTVPVITVITDLVDVHAGWACRDVDAVVIPSPGGLDRCRRAGHPGSSAATSSACRSTPPSRGPFPDDAERRALRARLGLAEDRFTVLVCSGADGSGGLHRRARAIADVRPRRRPGGDLRAQRGRAPAARGAARRLADARCPCSASSTTWRTGCAPPTSWSPRPAPGTIAEALCSGLPLLLTWYIPGQESGNLEWLVDIGAGRYVPAPRELVDTIAELSAPGSPGLAAMRAAVAAAARPEATERIAALIAGMAARPGSGA